MWATVPGTVTLSRPHSQFFNPQDSQETKFNGQSRLSNNVQIDGLDDNHKTGLLTVLIPSAESIDSVNVTTSNFDAEFGRAGGSVTTVVMKSGTNQVKGSVFAFGNTEAHPGPELLRVAHLEEARDEVPAVRRHARRPDRQGQAVLLHRLPAHGGQPRPAAPAW